MRLRDSLLKEIERDHDLRSFPVLDVGAGSGELLRVAAGGPVKLTGRHSWPALELNERSAKAILEESADFPEIASVQGGRVSAPVSRQMLSTTRFSR